MEFLKKLKNGLIKTRDNFSDKLKNVFAFFTKVDEEFLDKLEESLIVSDVSVDAALEIKNKLRDKCKRENIQSSDQIIEELKNIIKEILGNENSEELENSKKEVILVIGINGVGKTTSIGKLANLYRLEGKRVLIAAADTFRAAASEQLEIWAQRANCEILKKQEGSDPGAVVYEAIAKSKSFGYDCLICDTAGRLHNKSNLMAELQKIDRIVDKNMEKGYKKSIFLVLDASTGQNMVSQVEEFSKILCINGLILTKLDGTAKGGAIISVREKFKNIPIIYVGMGENIDDLYKFDFDKFVDVIIEKWYLGKNLTYCDEYDIIELLKLMKGWGGYLCQEIRKN